MDDRAQMEGLLWLLEVGDSEEGMTGQGGLDILEMDQDELDDALRREGLNPDLLGRRAMHLAAHHLSAEKKKSVGAKQSVQETPDFSPDGGARRMSRVVRAVCRPAGALSELFLVPRLHAVALASAEPGGAVQTGDETGILSFVVTEHVEDDGSGFLQVLVRTRMDDAFLNGVALLTMRVGNRVRHEYIPIVDGVGSIRIPFEPVRVDPDTVVFEVTMESQDQQE